MIRLLNVQSSPNLGSSASRSASRAYIDHFVATHPDTVVTDLDLVLSPPAHIGADHLGAFFAAPEFHSPASAAALRASEDYLEQLFDADVIVVGTPMHNLGIASVLKSWIDNILRAGRTFRYNEVGQAVGLVSGDKRLVVVVAYGGIYSDGPMAAFDYASNYIKAVFNFMGVTDVSIIRAEGMNMGPEMATRGLASAWAAAEALAQSQAEPDTEKQAAVA